MRMEADLLDQLHHPNIVRVHHLIQINSKLYMGMELLEGGSLGQFLNSKEGKNLSDMKASKIMKGILSALSYIHEKGIIHRDLKTANIIVSYT